MRNITVSIDDESYRRARLWAAERDLSISEMVRCILTTLPVRTSAKPWPAPPPDPQPPEPETQAPATHQPVTQNPAPGPRNPESATRIPDRAPDRIQEHAAPPAANLPAPTQPTPTRTAIIPVWGYLILRAAHRFLRARPVESAPDPPQK